MKEKEEKSELIEDENETVPTPQFTEEETKQLGMLKRRLETMKSARENPRPEFDNLPYTMYYLSNERGANTMINPTKNKGETNFQSGTLRTKLFSLLSSIEGLNLSPEILAYDKYDIVVSNLGQAMEDILERIDEQNNDEELKALRQYELLKQGTVFVETMWEDEYETRKIITSGSIGEKTGVAWETKEEYIGSKPKRKIISGLSVFLGSMNQYFIEKQPDIATVENIDYCDAERLYGDWEMFKYVQHDLKSFSGERLGMPWKLFDEQDTRNKVEVIKYQNLPANEFQIILNGIPMLPVGFPLPWGNWYSIDQQNLEPIRHDFAYGKSFIFKNKNLVAVLDEMMKLGVLKTQKSFMPPYFNQSGRVISRNVLMPSTITSGLRKGDLVPATEDENKGVTSSEFAMIQEVQNYIDRNTVSQTFTGARESGGTATATEISELQRQSKIMMGNLILACTLLEQKLASKSLLIVIDKWFDPIDQKLDEVRGVLVNRYRQIARVKNIGKEGVGTRFVIPSEQLPTSQEIKATEDLIKSKTGKPAKILMINPSALKQAKNTWFVSVSAKDKRTSELNKILLKDMIQTLMALGITPDPTYVSQLFAEAYDIDAEKLLPTAQPAPAPVEEGAEGGNQTGGSPQPSNIKPNVKATVKATMLK